MAGWASFDSPGYDVALAVSQENKAHWVYACGLSQRGLQTRSVYCWVASHRGRTFTRSEGAGFENCMEVY